MSVATPIIPSTCEGMGQIAPGTKLAVREMTDEELGHHVKELMDMDPEPWIRGVHPQRFVVVWADEPDQILFDWFSPVGHYNRELATKAAEKYARVRGATVVELG